MQEHGLPRSVLDTDHLDPGDRYDAWRDSFNVVFGYELSDEVPATQFRGRIDNTLFDHFMLTHFCASAARYERQTGRVARDGIDMVMLQLYLQGPCHFKSEGREGHSRVGDIVIMDMSRPIDTWHDFQENLTLCFPRELLLDVVPALDALHCRVLDADDAMTTILRSHMQALHRSVGTFTAETAGAVTSPTLELAGATIRSALGDGMDDSAPLRSAMRARADAVIERLLKAPDLSPDRIAAQVPCSRSRLFSLYRDDGGVMRHIQHRRLRGALRDLGTPQRRQQTIGMVASDWGFANVSSFNRVFKAEFGMTPSEARADLARHVVYHKTQGEIDSATNKSRQYEAWILRQLSSGAAPATP